MLFKSVLFNVHRSQEMEELAHVYKCTPMDMEQAHVHEVITVDIGMDEEMEEHVYEELQYMEKLSGRNVSQTIENTSGGMSALLPTAKSQQPQLCRPVNIHMRLSPPKQETREKTPPLPPKPGTTLPYNQLCIYQCYHPNYRSKHSCGSTYPNTHSAT